MMDLEQDGLSLTLPTPTAERHPAELGAGGQGEVWGVHIGSCDKAPLSRITAHTRTLTPPDKYVPLTNYTPFDP